MDNIIPLRRRKPQPAAKPEKVQYLEGEATCLECKHKWQAVKEHDPNGHNHGLECPSCHLMKGVFTNLCGTEKGTPVYRCGCSSYLFEARQHGLLCIYCGQHHSWDHMAKALGK
jgi:hypothetical protein